MKALALFCSIAALLLISAVPPAYAQSDDAGRSYGLRLGYGIDPDQFVIGGQADLGAIFKNFHFVPSIDAGFGDHLTTLCFNGDFKAFLPLPKSSVSFYGLAGSTITVWSPEEGDGDTEIGLSLGIGAQMQLGQSGWYNLEGRFGLSDIPDVRILFGVLFGGRK